jgi:hypothetical protein
MVKENVEYLCGLSDKCRLSLIVGAGLEGNGPHRLRHTFCSHLAMRGAAPRAIQELAGHAHFTTTQRYMHLSPAALDRAIDLLEPHSVEDFGDIVETPRRPITNSFPVNS